MDGLGVIVQLHTISWRNSFHFVLSWENHFRSSTEGATSFNHKSIEAFSF